MDVSRSFSDDLERPEDVWHETNSKELGEGSVWSLATGWLRGGGDRTNIHHDVSKAVTENTIVLNGSLRRIRNR